MKKYYTQKEYAFTLAEVLITLMIIGILAMVTIPSLVQSWEERATVSQLRKTYSVLQQAYKLAELEYGSPDTWDNNITEIGDNFVTFLALQINCKTNASGCFSTDIYKHLSGSDYRIVAGQDNFEDNTALYKTKLIDSASILIRRMPPYHCTSLDGKVDGNPACSWIFVDLNSNKPPNQWGKDLFAFSLTKTGILPWGGNGDTKYPHSLCKTYGYGCARWVIERGNMDYLHKITTW